MFYLRDYLFISKQFCIFFRTQEKAFIVSLDNAPYVFFGVAMEMLKHVEILGVFILLRAAGRPASSSYVWRRSKSQTLQFLDSQRRSHASSFYSTFLTTRGLPKTIWCDSTKEKCLLFLEQISVAADKGSLVSRKRAINFWVIWKRKSWNVPRFVWWRQRALR